MEILRAKGYAKFTIKSKRESVDAFRAYAEKRLKADPDWLTPLRGQNLACWCKPGDCCHGAVLLELANRKEA